MNIYSKQKNSQWKKTIISFTVIAAFTLALVLFEAPIRNSFYYVFSPIFQASWQSGDSTSGFLSSLFSFKRITLEREEIKKQNEILLLEIASLQDSLKEYQRINQVIQATKEDNFKLVSVRVVGQDMSSDFILINRGFADGIAEGMPLISSNKVLYGRVFKAYENFSQVMLISDKNSVVDVKIQAEEESRRPDSSVADPAAILKPVLGAVKGGGNLSLYLDLVASDANLAEGSNIITSGQEGFFPRNLLVGTVGVVHKNDAKPFQSADVRGFIDPRNMDNLFVITNYLRK